MYKIVSIYMKVTIKGYRKTIFKNKIKASVEKSYCPGDKLVKTDDVEEYLNTYKDKKCEEIYDDFKNGYMFYDSKNCIKFCEIENIEFKDKSNILDLEEITYEKLKSVVNVKELLEIKEYYRGIK